MFPLKNWLLTIPTSDHPGGFGYNRHYDLHTGIDLYCTEGTQVYSIVDGEIINILPFTGKEAESPWWEETFAIIVKSNHSYETILYGEIIPNQSLYIGDQIKTGTLLGTVKRVLKNDKGLPMTMLHVECYENGITEPVWWYNNHKPEKLLDPYKMLLQELLMRK